MSHNNSTPPEEFQYTPTNNYYNLTTVPKSNCFQMLIEMRDEIRSLKSEISTLTKKVTDSEEGNKRSMTKLTEEVIAVKLENRKQHADKILTEEFKEIKNFPLQNIDDLTKFDHQIQQNEEMLKQFKLFIGKQGGDNATQFLRIAIRKVFTDELVSLYSWKGTCTKPSAENIYIITIIKNICHLNYKNTDKEMNAVLQKHFVHAKDRVVKRQRHK